MSGIEWASLTGSTTNGPASISSPGCTSSSGTSLSLCSSSLERTMAMVSGPP